MERYQMDRNKIKDQAYSRYASAIRSGEELLTVEVQK